MSYQPSQLTLPISDLSVSLAGELPKRHRIYCNRNLRLDHVTMVGFDMDYTLAMYNQRQMDRLSIEATARKLVERGYPEKLLHMDYRTNFPIRGLLVDKKLGNVLKTDRYRYVKVAYHGTRRLTKAERRKHYQDSKRVRAGTRRYYSIDTLYALSEVAVFAAVVDALDTPDNRLDYPRIFDDVRQCIDLAHRDGTIKTEIERRPEQYIERDPLLGPMLHKLRSAGKKLFLLTNSSAPYTDTVMSYLLHNGTSEYRSWKSYFDIIVTDARKPRFFTRDAPFLTEDGKHASALERGHVYRQGSLPAFQRLTQTSGEEVLYIGDHIFGDVLRAKKDSAWRTIMIIQELDAELEAVEQYAPTIERMSALEQRRYTLLDTLRERHSALKVLQRQLDDDPDAESRTQLVAARLRTKRATEKLRAQLKAVDHEYAELEARVDQALHPYWGSCFKAGSELSSFGEQVERYACLYTDRVTNLTRYSVGHFFRGPRHRMAHESG